MRRIVLFATLAAACILRLAGIGWGLPPVTPHVRTSDLRSSYAFDEDDILSGAAKASVARLDLDPHEYHWGTLHIELVLLALDGAQAAGVFHVPWRTAYYELVERDFVRVYIAGRLVATAMALVTIWLLFQLPFEGAGAFCGMLVAVSPAHVLQSDQVRVDVTMTAMLVLMLLLALRHTVPVWVGFAGGLALASKYSAVTVVPAMALGAVRPSWKAYGALLTGAVSGFIAGGPYIAIKPRAFYDEITRYTTGNSQVPREYVISTSKLLVLHMANLARFGMGVPAFLLALAGLGWMLKRRSAGDRIILLGIAGYLAILVPLRWPLIRYDLPLLVFFGLASGLALERLPFAWRSWLAAAALVMPLAGTIAQIHYMRAPHPANVMLDRILESVPPGSPITRLFRDSPPLDGKIYPLGRDLFLDDLTRDPPDWVLLSDLPDLPYQSSTLELLRTRYDETARAGIRRILAWATLGESGAPHDWKYTHPTFTLYHKKSP